MVFKFQKKLTKALWYYSWKLPLDCSVDETQRHVKFLARGWITFAKEAIVALRNSRLLTIEFFQGWGKRKITSAMCCKSQFSFSCRMHVSSNLQLVMTEASSIPYPFNVNQWKYVKNCKSRERISFLVVLTSDLTRDLISQRRQKKKFNQYCKAGKT